MKKIVISIICILCGLLFFLYAKGRPLNIKVDKNVNNLPRDISDIVYYASLAPNSHNTQLWKVSINTNTNTLKIYIDNDRTLKEVDNNNREAYISIGAFTSNLLKAFQGYGYDTKLSISEEYSKELVAVSYTKSHVLNEDKNICELILKRHTDKRAFLDREITNDINTILNKNTILYKKGTEQFQYLKTTEMAAMKQQSYNKAKAEEFANWLRFSDKEAEFKKDGLPAEQLGLTGIIKSLYYLTTSKEDAKGKSYAEESIKTTNRQVENCAGFLIITGGTSRKELIETGINMENAWLDAVKKGISVQPMSQILEEKPYMNEVDAKLKTKLPVQMILRLGYTKDYGRNNNIRRNLKDYVTVETSN